MTITEATHALATQGRRSAPAHASLRVSDDRVRLVDLVTSGEPTWVEAVAVVQAVCAQLKPGDAAPAFDGIRISSSGTVSFEPAGTADDLATVMAMGQLLAAILRAGDCPLPVWEASERARRAPAAVGDARAFGALLTCLPPAHGPRELAQFVKSAQAQAAPEPPPVVSAEPRRRMTLWARAGLVAWVVAMGGIGAGVSVCALLATKALGAPVAPRVAGVEARR
jgi:hypothetical protein